LPSTGSRYGISADSINDGVEFGMQRHRVATDRIRKSGVSVFSVHNNVSKSSRIIARDEKHSADAFDRTEVSVLKE